MSLREFSTLVSAIYVADCLFEITKLVVEEMLRRSRRPARDSRGRFAHVRARI